MAKATGTAKSAKPPVNVSDEVSRGIIALLLKEPFYGHLLGGVVRSVDDRIPTAAVAITPQGLQLIVNPLFFMNELKKDERVAVIKHEALHLLFRHLYRPLLKKGDAKLFNIAADLVVNQHIAPWPLPDMAVTIKQFPDMGLEPNMTLEWYYERLSNLRDDMQSGQDDEGEKGEKGTSGDKSPISKKALKQALIQKQQGDHSFWISGAGTELNESGAESPITEAMRQALESDLERHLLRAKDQTTAKAWGSIPSQIRQELEAMAERRKPQIDWKRTLRLFASSGYRTKVVATNRRASKRFGTFPGIRIQRKQRIAVVIDTSGSIQENTLTLFFSEIHGIWKNGAEIIVVECDAAVQQTYSYKGKKPTEVQGGGGTLFDPALAWVRTPRNGPFDACIFLTDGYASEPTTPPRCPLLWVVTSDGNTGDHLKFGRTVKLPAT